MRTKFIGVSIDDLGHTFPPEADHLKFVRCRVTRLEGKNPAKKRKRCDGEKETTEDKRTRKRDPKEATQEK